MMSSKLTREPLLKLLFRPKGEIFNFHMPNIPPGSNTKQQGAALLAFMLVLLVGSSYMLVSRLNEHTQTYMRDIQTQKALSEAKRALLSYAMNYPELRNSDYKGPGYLPCPDHDGDGNPQSSCTFNPDNNRYTTFGRLPFRILGFDDLKDSSGERLWYAVSDNFKNTQSNNAVINSETPGLLNAVNQDGSITDNIVAVIIAPGEPVSGQAGRRGNEETAAITSSPAEIYLVADQYFEGANAVYSNTTFEINKGDDFNDRIVTITRRELMAVVEQRVANEARRILAHYYADYGHYPWLAPFADPKAGARWFWGTAGSNSDATTLFDNTADFIAAKVREGDIVWNITGGSWGRVSDDPTDRRTLKIDDGLAFGSINEFREGDEYFINIRDFPQAIRGVASSGSSGSFLVDTDTNFEKLGVIPGDVIEKLDSSGVVSASGLISSVSNSEIVALNEIEFNPDDEYRIRSNSGIATSGSSGLTLVDTTMAFIALGVQAGHAVRNLTDGSVGIIATVTSDSLGLESLAGGENNVFAPGDFYQISRFNSAVDISTGLLPVHEPGEAINTGFNVDWLMTSGNNNVVNLIYTGSDPDYNAGLENAVQESNLHSGTVSVPAVDTRCIWINKNVVDCAGTYRDDEFLSGTVESSQPGQFVDSSKDFPSIGIKKGDKLENKDTGGVGLVYDVTTDSIDFVRIHPDDLPVFNPPDDAYRIRMATDVTDPVEAADPTISGPWPDAADDEGRVYFSGTEQTEQSVFASTEIGDIIEFTTVNTGGLGRVTLKGEEEKVVTEECLFFHPVQVDRCLVGRIEAKEYYYFNYTKLQGGSVDYFDVGDTFIVHQNYVAQREYEFNIRLAGEHVVVENNAGMRARTVCRGYGDECAAGPTPVSTIGDYDNVSGDGLALVTIRDFDDADPANLLGEASVSVPSAGAASSIRVASLNYQSVESEEYELPAWFLRNRWHQYVYVAYSDEFKPNGTGNCTPDEDCLTLNIHRGSNTPEVRDDIQAIVLSMGGQLEGRNRGIPLLENYLERENADESNPLIFERNWISEDFNDQVSVVCPDPYYPYPNIPICPP